jgi:RNA polymerase sigma-32 factor
MTLAMTLPVPAIGTLETYVQAVNRFPLLTQQEEIDLARRLRKDNDIEAAQKLVLSHLRVVVSIARGYLGYGLPHADLIQEGNVGLMKAVKRYDPERGVRLVSFAIHWIKAEIHEYVLRNWRLVKIATTKAQRKLFFNLRSMKPTLDHLTQDEIGAMAKELRVKPEEVREMEMRLAGQEMALESHGEDDEDSYSPIAWLSDPEAEPSRIVESEQIERLRDDGLKTALANLDARSRRIIEARWLREKDQATLHDLADEFKVSAERIRQIEAKALQKMKGAMAAA